MWTARAQPDIIGGFRDAKEGNQELCMCLKEEQQKVTTKPARKREKKMSARHAESLGVSVQNHASAGGKKIDRDVCAGRGASKTFGGKARSGRDRLP
jgi:hypothetical protein